MFGGCEKAAAYRRVYGFGHLTAEDRDQLRNQRAHEYGTTIDCSKIYGAVTDAFSEQKVESCCSEIPVTFI